MGCASYLLLIGSLIRNSFFERNNSMNLVRSYNNWRTYRNTVGELVQLSDRELNDMGIGRADIRNVARRALGK